MALDYLPSPGWAVIYGETPSATRWSELGDNDDSLATGAGIDDLAILNRHLALSSVKENNLSTVAGELGAAWTAWVPTVSNSGGTVSATVNYARYKRVGKMLFWQASITVNSVSAGGGLRFTPPVNSINNDQWAGAGREDSTTGKMTEVIFKGSTSLISIFYYDNTGNTASGGARHIIGGSYECA